MSSQDPSSSSSSSSSRSEFRLSSPPGDGISRVRFGPASSQFLLVSSWDNTIRLYDVLNHTQRVRFDHAAPALDCCFQVGTKSCIGKLIVFD